MYPNPATIVSYEAAPLVISEKKSQISNQVVALLPESVVTYMQEIR